MNNILKTSLTIFIFSLIFISKIYASELVTTNKDNIKNGIIILKYAGSFEKEMKVTVEKDGERYIYDIKSNDEINIPLQMGNGTYKISVLKHVFGTKFEGVFGETIEATNIDQTNLYTFSTPITNFNNSMTSINAYSNILKEKEYNDKIKILYVDVIKNYIYDYEKAKTVENGYVPFIDEMYSTKKGICYDYSALMAGVLRSQGIPTKLVMGYAPEIKSYHAWNEIFIDKKWVVVDTTYDASKIQAGQKTTFSKDADKFKVVKIY